MTKTCWTYEEILQDLPAIIGDCLGVDESEVVPQANFFDDLGGESIDQLDLSFRCERAFGVKGPFHALVEMGTSSLDADGCVDPTVIDAACRRFPFLQAALDSLGSDRMHPLDLRRVFTVGVIAHFVEAAGLRGVEP